MRLITVLFILSVLVLVNACSSDSEAVTDSDADMISDDVDNCPEIHNPDQTATIGPATELGDACDDEDADGVVDAADNCPLLANADQDDTDGNGVGDACEYCGTVAKIMDLSNVGSSIAYGPMASLNSMVYFRAQDATLGNELWRFDPSGSSPNAQLVADIASGEDSSVPSRLTELAGSLYFRANDMEHGTELWVYDPAAGASLVSDINPGSDDAYPDWLTVVDNRLYFSADDGIHGTELWMLDPADTAAGPIMVADSNPEGGSNPREFASLNGNLYFFSADENDRLKLWIYEPDKGARVVADLFEDDANGNPSVDNLVAFDEKLYFRYWGSEGFGLWVYEPQAANENTFPVVLVGTHFDGEAQDLSILDGKLYFTTRTPLYGRELWNYDPAGGATLGVDAFPGTGNGRPSPEYDSPIATPLLDTLSPVELEGLIYLNANNGISGYELMSFDPSSPSSSIRLVADINPGAGNAYPMNMMALDGKLYFMINTFMGSEEPWYWGVDELWVFDPSCMSEPNP